jgi:N-acyl homoserine lactone hydrolase
MTTDQWTIVPLVLGSAVRDKSQALLFRDVGIKAKGFILAWLLMSGDKKILVDTGAFGPVERPEVRSRYDQTSEQTMHHQLARFHMTIDEITTVINTHLHLDHAGGNAYFPKARFFVQKREMEYAKDPVPIHKGSYDLDFTGMKFEYLDGDADIASGIKVILTPGHSPGSQAVLVETTQGTYIIAGDTITHFEQMSIPGSDSFWPGAIYVDLREYYRSLDCLKRLGGFILPGHDLLVLEKDIYP